MYNRGGGYMMEKIFRIDGMSCGGCVRGVSGVLRALPGVHVDEVYIGRATVRMDPAKTTQDQLIRALADAGYRAREE